MSTTASLSGLAAALSYPATDEARAGLARFEHLKDRPRDELEELYTRTFDVNPVCSLEVGWHLFGEDYARGAFLVKARGLLREVGIEEGGELPDHLTSLLKAMDRLDEETAGTLSRRFVSPAVVKMLGGFDQSPYRAVVSDVDRVLRERFGEPEEVSAPVETQPYACGGCHGIA